MIIKIQIIVTQNANAKDPAKGSVDASTYLACKFTKVKYFGEISIVAL